MECNPSCPEYGARHASCSLLDKYDRMYKCDELRNRGECPLEGEKK